MTAAKPAATGTAPRLWRGEVETEELLRLDRQDGSQTGPRAVPARRRTRSELTERVARWFTACIAVSKPSPRWESSRPDVVTDHSSRIEKSVGSWTSATNTPAPIACGVSGRHQDAVAGTHLDPVEARRASSRRPGRRSRRDQLVGVDVLGPAEVHGRARRRRRGRTTPRSCRRGRPGGVAAKARSGWTCTGSRWPASSSLTSSAGVAGRGSPARIRRRSSPADRRRPGRAAARRRSCGPARPWLAGARARSPRATPRAGASDVVSMPRSAAICAPPA